MLPEAATADCSDKNAAGQLLSVIEQVQPCDQRTHRVPEQEIRQVGIAALHQVGQVLDILNKILPTVAGQQKNRDPPCVRPMLRVRYDRFRRQ